MRMIKHDRQAILAALSTLAPSGVVELRALDCDPTGGYDRTVSGYFDAAHHEALADAIERMCAHASGVYITLQEVSADCLARANNRARAVKKRDATTTDADIVGYRWLPLDFDPIRTKGVSSSSEELLRAHEAARAVHVALSAEGWPEPVYASSGNGAHLLYRLPEGWAGPKDGARVQAMIAALIARFKGDCEGVDLDPKVFNPSRIWKLYGTVARKGDATEARPHRLSQILSAPPDQGEVPVTLLDALAGEGARVLAPAPKGTRLSAVLALAAPPEPAPKQAAAVADSPARQASEDSVSKIQGALLHIPADDRDVWLAVGGALHHWGGPEARWLWDDWSASSAKCDPKAQDKTWAGFGTSNKAPKTLGTLYKLAQENGWEHPATKLKREAAEAKAQGGGAKVLPMRASKAANQPPPAAPPAAPAGVGYWQHQPNDCDLAMRMLGEVEGSAGTSCVYDEGNLWRYRKDKGYWARVTQADVTKACARWHEEPILDEYGHEKKGKDSKVLISSGECRGAFWMACQTRDEEGFFGDAKGGVVTADGLHLWADTVGCTIEVAPVSPGSRARAALSCTLDPDAKGSLLTHYLSTVHAGQPDEIDKVRLMGEIAFVALMGLGPHFNKAVLAFGGQGTGKSQFLEILSGLVPAEARSVIQPHEIAHEYYGALLVGKSLNVVTECNEAEVMGEAGFKAVISGEPVTRRQIRGEPFTFRPRALHVFAGNKLPPAPGASDAFWVRWLPIGFTRTFRSTDKEIKHLGKRIVQEELGAVLAWAMRCGADLLKRGRYTMPSSVAALFAEWRERSDSVAAWVSEETLPATSTSASSWLSASLAYSSYKMWCEAGGYRPVNRSTMKDRLEGAGIAFSRSNGSRYALKLKGDAVDSGTPF